MQELNGSLKYEIIYYLGRYYQTGYAKRKGTEQAETNPIIWIIWAD